MNRLPLPLLLVLALLMGWGLNHVFSPAPEGRDDSKRPGQTTSASSRGSAEGASAGEAAAANETARGESLEGEGQDGKPISAELMTERINELSNSPSMSNARETLDLIAGLSQDGLRELLLNDESGGWGMSDGMVSSLAFMAWVDRDPQAAFDFYQNELPAGNRSRHSMSLFSAWAGVDPEAAAAAAAQIESGHDRSLANYAIARAMLDTDPNRAFEVLEQGGAICGVGVTMPCLRNGRRRIPPVRWQRLKPCQVGRCVIMPCRDM